MKFLVLGSGLMGPAAAFNAMSDPEVKQVTICDMSQVQLDTAMAKLRDKPGRDRLHPVVLDLNDRAAAQSLVADHDVVLAALPHAAIPLGIRAAAGAGKPLIDLSWPDQENVPAVRQEVATTGNLVILGCGVEPGLTEIVARFLAEKLDRVEELHIKCGGIPAQPAPPLGYKIVFGGRHLPLRPTDALIADSGTLRPVPRYSGVETVVFSGIGECEAWHEGFMPWLLDLGALQGLKLGTQKTVRWPGYAAKVSVLRDLGLLGNQPIDVDGVSVAPKALLDALLYSQVRMENDEEDVTAFRVEALGIRKGRRRRYQIEMVDRYDAEQGFTSMARVTAFTGAIVARMVGRGQIHATGLQTPEKLITGRLFDQLVDELKEARIYFHLTTEKEKTL